MDDPGRSEVAQSGPEPRGLHLPARRERALPAWLERLRDQRRAPSEVVDGELIVRRYFPRNTRTESDIVVDAPAESCARCARSFAGGHTVVHSWKLRRGVRALRDSLTLCDDCDRGLRPYAYLGSAVRG